MDPLGEPKCGTWVRIRPLAEILPTLDDRGTLGGLPFMPEMAGFCGRVFRVRAQPGKTCVDARPMEMRSFAMNDVFLLESVRCPGTAHGGCERECLVFWRRQWLEPVPAAGRPTASFPGSTAAPLLPVVRADGGYFCQSTALRNATEPLASRGRLGVMWWDWRRGNLTAGQLLARVVVPAGRKLMRRLRGTWPRGLLRKTPSGTLDLQAGNLVRVRPLAEIQATLDTEGRNRGLVFEPDMAGFCGQTRRVRRRVERMISEPTGKMLNLTNTVTLEEIVCTCPFTYGGCPRAELQLWREIWLEKV